MLQIFLLLEEASSDLDQKMVKLKTAISRMRKAPDIEKLRREADVAYAEFQAAHEKYADIFKLLKNLAKKAKEEARAAVEQEENLRQER